MNVFIYRNPGGVNGEPQSVPEGALYLSPLPGLSFLKKASFSALSNVEKEKTRKSFTYLLPLHAVAAPERISTMHYALCHLRPPPHHPYTLVSHITLTPQPPPRSPAPPSSRRLSPLVY